MKRKLTISILLALLVPGNAVLAAYNSMLAPTLYTPSTYEAPHYDPFDPDFSLPIPLPVEDADSPPRADFSISNSRVRPGLPASNAGTTQTEFVFDANSSTDAETESGRLEVRWDFENDGVFDRFFSRTKTVRHRFKQPGVYQVSLEVLDRGGNVSTAVRTVTIVNNTAPTASFQFAPASGTPANIFSFRTDTSSDDQYVDTALQYRFDWNGDGKWDTNFQSKTQWNHQFERAGTYTVIMETRDPEGLSARAQARIVVNPNTAPHAEFSIKTVRNSYGTTYQFDASKSFDEETAHHRLFYRWDFNYRGQDDIRYNTSATTSDRYSGTYALPGRRIIRLEVTDADGAKAYAYAAIEVEEQDIVQGY